MDPRYGSHFHRRGSREGARHHPYQVVLTVDKWAATHCVETPGLGLP